MAKLNYEYFTCGVFNLNQKTINNMIEDVRALQARNEELEEALHAEVEKAFTAGWTARGECDARLFEEGIIYNEQTFTDGDDSVMLTFRVMAIIAHTIRTVGSKR